MFYKKKKIMWTIPPRFTELIESFNTSMSFWVAVESFDSV